MKTLSIDVETQFEREETSDDLLDRVTTALTEAGINASLTPIETHERED